HASGLPPDDTTPIAEPGRRRIYSNTGFEVAAALVGERAQMSFGDYFEHVWGFPLAGSPASGVEGGLGELVTVARELLPPPRGSPTQSSRSVLRVGVLDGWKMCPRCAAGLELDQGKASCPACDSVYYANSAPAVEGVLERDGKVLLTKRGIDPRRGYWDLPGG